MEHVLDVFLLLVPFLCGEDLEYLNHPSKAPNAKTKSGKETHLNRRIETQCLSPFPALHASGANARAILIRPYEKAEVERDGSGTITADTYKSNTLRISCIFVCFSP